MKSLLFLFFYLLICSSVFAQHQATLKGYLDTSSDSHLIILQRFDGKSYHAVDSVDTEHQSFSFQRPEKEINLYSLIVAGKRGDFRFIWDKDVKVNLNTESLWLSTIEGSPASEEYLLYEEKTQPLKEQVIHYSMKFNEPNLSEDSVRYFENKQNQVVDSIFNHALHYVKTNQSSFTTVYLLHWAQGFRDMEPDEFLFYYNQLSDEWKEHYLAQDMMSSITRKAEMKRSYEEKWEAPKFSARSLLTQKEVNLDQLLLEKKPIVLDFWGI